MFFINLYMKIQKLFQVSLITGVSVAIRVSVMIQKMYTAYKKFSKNFR